MRKVTMLEQFLCDFVDRHNVKINSDIYVRLVTFYVPKKDFKIKIYITTYDYKYFNYFLN